MCELIDNLVYAYMPPENAAKFKILLERRPRWLLLLLYLRKYIRLSFSEACRLVGIKYPTLINALAYLAGMPEIKRKGARGAFIASTLARPLVAIETLSYNEKFIVLTQYGKEFADQAVKMLKDIAVRYGAVDWEKDLGISFATIIGELSRELREHGIFVDPEGFERRVVDWRKLVRNLSPTCPVLLKVMIPTVVDAIPLRIVTASGASYELYAIP